MVESKTEALELDAEEQRFYERLKGCFDAEARRVAKLLASKEDRQLFGETEFELRDRMHRLGAQVLETAAQERQKKGRVRGC